MNAYKSIFSLFLYAASDIPAVTNIPADTVSKSCQCTTVIAFASILSVVLAVCVVVFTTVIIVFIRSKKPAQPEAYYDTINIRHHSPPPIIDTEMNVAYGHTKKHAVIA